MIELAIRHGASRLHARQGGCRGATGTCSRSRPAGAPLPPIGTAPFANGCVLAGSPGAGELFPQPTSGHGRRRLRLDDGLGEGPWLICRRAIAGVTGLATRHLDEPTLAPFRADLLRWFEARDIEAVLVRRRLRYVFGTGEPAALAAAWAAALKPARESALAPV